MGVDLTLLPVDAEISSDWWFSHNVLRLERRHELWDAVRSLRPEQPVADRFETFCARDDDGEYKYGDTQRTAYGEQLGWLTVDDLLMLTNHIGVVDNTLNRAAWAYLHELPLTTKIALYWH